MPFELGAFATRSNQVSLYWGAYANASGYNIYRGTAAGHESAIPLNQAPYSRLDPNPTAHAFLFNDPRLVTGKTYYYIVKAVVGGREVKTTLESSATPDATAIPYDTCDAAKILQAENRPMASIVNSLPGARYKGPMNVSVQGPDGQAYSMEPDAHGRLVPTSTPPSSYFDDRTGLMHDSDGTTYPMPMDFPSDANRGHRH